MPTHSGPNDKTLLFLFFLYFFRILFVVGVNKMVSTKEESKTDLAVVYNVTSVDCRRLSLVVHVEPKT